MIADLAGRLAGAIAAKVGPGIAVTPYVPETVAGPAVHLRLATATYSPEGWLVTHDVVITASDALAAGDAAEQVSGLLDVVLSAALELTAGRNISGRAETSRVGDTSSPGAVVAVAQLTPYC